MKNIRIRNAVISDIDKISSLLYQVQKVHSDVRPDLFVEGSRKYSDEQLRQIIADETRPVFVAEENGTVVGYAFCAFVGNGGSTALADIKTLYIDDLGVDENHRGKGIGKLLYEHAVDFAKKSACYNLTLNVWADNCSAVAFYEKIGMKKQKIGMETIL